MFATLKGKGCCLSSTQLGGVALSVELQPGVEGTPTVEEKGGMVGFGRGWRKNKDRGIKVKQKTSEQYDELGRGQTGSSFSLM